MNADFNTEVTVCENESVELVTNEDFISATSSAESFDADESGSTENFDDALSSKSGNQGFENAEATNTTDHQTPTVTLESDLGVLLNEFPELCSTALGSVNKRRYEELRALGLSTREAYLAASASGTQNNKSHLITSVPAGAKSPELGMSSYDMEVARGLFEGLSESEIKRLYSKVTK